MTIRYAVPDDVPALSAVEAECFPLAEAATAAEFAERVAHYADDGYTGTNFERPGFTQMMEDIQSDKINCIIVKDYCAIIGLNQKGLENQGILA